MKKVSTVAAKRTRNFQDQKLTIGLDLGDRTSWYCVLDGAGEVVLEQKLSTTPKATKIPHLHFSALLLQSGVGVEKGLRGIGSSWVWALRRGIVSCEG